MTVPPDPQYRFEQYDELATWQETLRDAIGSKLSVDRWNDDPPPPPDGAGPYPVMICLQGHAPGMCLSLGETYADDDATLIDGDRDFAVQAVERGWAALVIEQAGFGERAPLPPLPTSRVAIWPSDCYFEGSRCWASASPTSVGPST